MKTIDLRGFCCIVKGIVQFCMISCNLQRILDYLNEFVLFCHVASHFHDFAFILGKLRDMIDF